MGRTATAFLVLIAVGGCVADDQGPAAAVLAAQQGQPIAVAAPAYATWNKTDQFAVLQDSTPTMAPSQPLPAPVRMTQTTALKPTAVHKPIVVPAPTDKPAPAEPMVDPDLAQATLVQTPGNSDPSTRETVAPAKPAGPSPETKLAGPSSDSKLKDLGADSKLKDLGRRSSKLNNLNTEADAPPPLTAGTATRMVNSKRITLNYELKDAGNTGVTGVELWCTQDTRTWKKGEIIAQTNHSYTVEVKDEGLYGFTLLPRNAAGPGKEPPQPGDQPQVWVSVDVTKPVVQITSLELTHVGKGTCMMIRWTAKDKNMGPRPINLAYAEEPEGPWTPIAAGLENNGQYEWQPTGGLPHHVYVRVEAADLHGNVGQVMTANPLRFDTGRPRRRRCRRPRRRPSSASAAAAFDALAGLQRGTAQHRHPGRGVERQLRVPERELCPPTNGERGA